MWHLTCAVCPISNSKARVHLPQVRDLSNACPFLSLSTQRERQPVTLPATIETEQSICLCDQSAAFFHAHVRFWLSLSLIIGFKGKSQRLSSGKLLLDWDWIQTFCPQNKVHNYFQFLWLALICHFILRNPLIKWFLLANLLCNFCVCLLWMLSRSLSLFCSRFASSSPGILCLKSSCFCSFGSLRILNVKNRSTVSHHLSYAVQVSLSIHNCWIESSKNHYKVSINKISFDPHVFHFAYDQIKRT